MTLAVLAASAPLGAEYKLCKEGMSVTAGKLRLFATGLVPAGGYEGLSNGSTASLSMYNINTTAECAEVVASLPDECTGAFLWSDTFSPTAASERNAWECRCVSAGAVGARVEPSTNWNLYVVQGMDTSLESCRTNPPSATAAVFTAPENVTPATQTVNTTNATSAATNDLWAQFAPQSDENVSSSVLAEANEYDDPHVKTLSGERFLMHGIGAFNYATGPGLQAQVFMCPFAPCNADMMQQGECPTYVQAVAIKTPSHKVVLRGSELLVDGRDMQGHIGPAGSTIALGKELTVSATGSAAASSKRPRVNHNDVAECGRPQVANRSDHDCSTVQWSLRAASMTINVDVVGPFEEGFLNEQVGNRTFNIELHNVKSPAAVRGVVNGDRNGFFEQAPLYQYFKGTLQPHSAATEITAANVPDSKSIFPPKMLAHMKQKCGPSKPLGGVQLVDEKPSAATMRLMRMPTVRARVISQ